MTEKQTPQPATDHDLLIRIDERVRELDVCMRNHLTHHVRLEISILVAIVAAAIGVIVHVCANL